jgi:hypothetical protein
MIRVGTVFSVLEKSTNKGGRDRAWNLGFPQVDALS